MRVCHVIEVIHLTVMGCDPGSQGTQYPSGRTAPCHSSRYHISLDVELTMHIVSSFCILRCDIKNNIGAGETAQWVKVLAMQV